MDRQNSPTRSLWLGPKFVAPAKNIVSLVPSLTQSIFMLGAGDLLIGRTEYCVKPAGEVERVRTVGGTKNIDTAGIIALAPDVVLANREENVKDQILALAEKVPVLLTDPLEPDDIPALWTELGDATGKKDQARAFADDVLTALAELRLTQLYAENRGPRFVYFVWKNPWMAAGHDTFISRMLSAAGFRNALPPEDLRFPAVTEEKIFSLAPDVYFYCSEPYSFKLPGDLLLPENTEAAELEPKVFLLGQIARALFVNSEPLSWYPSQTSDGLRYVSRLLKTIQGDM